MVEAWCWRVVIPLFFVCRRPQAGMNLKLRDLAPFRVQSIVSRAPAYTLLGYLGGASIIPILPYRTWEEDGWCLSDGLWWGPCACTCACTCLCLLCVCVWHEPPNQARVTQEGDFPKLQHQGDRDKERDHHVQQRSSPISNTRACNGISSIIDASSYTHSR